jgi:hypothetical protein
MAADTFLRAVRALDNLPRFWSGPPTFEKPTALSPEQKAQIGKMYDAGAPQARVATDLIHALHINNLIFDYDGAGSINAVGEWGGIHYSLRFCLTACCLGAVGATSPHISTSKGRW